MFNLPTAHLAAWTTILAGALVGPAASFACSPANCSNAWFGPAVVGTVPANTPALPLYLPYKDGQPTEPLSLVHADSGAAIPYQLQTGWPSWLRLAAPLIAGAEYKLTVVVGCQYMSPDGVTPPPQETLTFVAGPAAPTPTSAGELILAQPVLKQVKTGTSAGSCTVSVDGVSQTVQLQPHPSLLPWLGVASLELFAAGASWSKGKSGQFALAGQPLPTLTETTTRTNWQIYAVCQDLPLHASPGLAPGYPLLSALVHLPPGMTPLDISAQASLLCDPPVVSADAGLGVDSAAEDAVAGADSGAGGEASLPLSPHSGCTAGRRAGPLPLALLVVALGGLLLLRRRFRWLEQHRRPATCPTR